MMTTAVPCLHHRLMHMLFEHDKHPKLLKEDHKLHKGALLYDWPDPRAGFLSIRMGAWPVERLVSFEDVRSLMMMHRTRVDG